MIITLANGKTIESDEFYRMSVHEQRALIQWNTPELRAKLEAARKTQYTPEVRAKMSQIVSEAMTAERREQMSKTSTNLWQDPEYVKRQMRRRQSQEYKNNHKKAVKNCERVIERQPVKSPDGVVYDTISDAAKAIGMDTSSIHYRLKKPNSGWTRLPKVKVKVNPILAK